MGAGGGGGNEGEGGGRERGKEDARRDGEEGMQFSSRHLRALVPTAVTAGRLGCPGGSQLGDALPVGRALPTQQPPQKVSALPGRRGRGSDRQLWSQSLLRMGKECVCVWGGLDRLLDGETPVPVTLQCLPGVCFRSLPPLPLSISLSLPWRPSGTLSPSFSRFSRSAGASRFLSFPLSLLVSASLARCLSPGAVECWLSRSPRSLSVCQGRARLTSLLCPDAGRLPSACGFPKRSGLRLLPSGELHPLVPRGSRSPRCRSSPSAHRLDGPPAAEGTDRLPLRAEPQR